MRWKGSLAVLVLAAAALLVGVPARSDVKRTPAKKDFILRKLDQVLSNQARMRRDLETIRAKLGDIERGIEALRPEPGEGEEDREI